MPEQQPPAVLERVGALPLPGDGPTRIGPYALVGVLGSGGMGRVYLGRPADGGPGLVAVKVIRPEYAEDPSFRRRFEREAAVVGRVRSAHAPALTGTGYDGELLWMGTEFIPGISLAAAVKAYGPLEPAGVWRLVGHLGRAVSALAAVGVVHRDLKPSNVILSATGAHVIDFGISHSVESTAITSTGARVGTPSYMSPEHLRDGRTDTASDVFSLACTLMYAATGHAPFGDGTGVDVMHRVAYEQPRPEVIGALAAADPRLAELLAACLAKEPERRPIPQYLADAAARSQGAEPQWQEPLAGEVRERQRAFEVLTSMNVEHTVFLRPSNGIPAGNPDARPTVASPATVARSRRRRTGIAVAAAVAVCAVAVGGVLMVRGGGSEGDTATTASSASAPVGAKESQAGGSSELGGSEVGATPSASGRKTPDGAASSTPKPGASGSGAGAPSAKATRRTSAPTRGATASTSTKPAPKPTPKPTPAWISQCTYYSGTVQTEAGDKGQRVVQVQCMLTKRGYSVGSSGVDGDFGADTTAAVKRFQSARGLEVDGQVGPNTWAALRSWT
ncbi:serine/threonine-protein kinase [Streptomyces sp. NPDC050738]|uniref:serine/threonine-protein kinase n=1 Tax=Streptomyces sp. NPDC050738 TaxID=3154744 RepID=UPI003419B465